MTASIRIALSALAVLSTFGPVAANAQGFAVGQRAECDATGLKKYYKPGKIVPTNPGETFNGYAAATGYFFRLQIDGGSPEGVLCKAEDMRALQAAPPTAASISSRPAMVPAAAAREAADARNASGLERFGARSPRVSCPTVKSMPNPEQIKALVQCDHERSSNNDLIYLDENLSVQAGGTRKYNQFADGYATGIDTDAPVLPIRGMLDTYQCAVLSKYTNVGTVYDTDNSGKNCAVTPIRQAQGNCWRTTFGEWSCHLNVNVDSSLTRLNQPPPK